MLTVACVRVGEAFGVHYVERLYDMVSRNLPAGFQGRFVCLTDRPWDLKKIEGVQPIDISVEMLDGEWAKMALFREDTFTKNERVWVFDLETLIVGPLDKLFEYSGSFGIQSTVMSFIAGTKLTTSIWDLWHGNGCPTPQGGLSEVLDLFWHLWLPRLLGDAPWPPDDLHREFPGKIRSYEPDCVPAPPKKTAVVCFDHVRKLEGLELGWVPEVWRLNGGTSREIVTVGTVSEDVALKNVENALLQGYREMELQAAHGLSIAIVGGGPSLRDQIPFIRQLQATGVTVMSLNNVDQYLRRAGVVPELHVMMDARMDIHDFVQTGGVKLYASMCDPSVLRAGDAHGDLVLWHCAREPTLHLFEKKLAIGGGSTVGTFSINLAWALGYRQLLVFGFDSSYADGAHHAYDQSLNDQERIVDVTVAGQKFVAAAWMVEQAEQFKDLSIQLAALGVKITLYGDGLLPALMKSTLETDK